MARLYDAGVTLDGIDAHPHAKAVLGPAVPPAGSPSHAYLFHGPSGAGKRDVARAFAAALLADGAPTPATTAGRVAREAHPDLTWVRPSGAGEMLVGDVAAVVAGAAHTPFEARRRVFVLEDAHTLNDQAANRLLKTLEEPPAHVHLILLAPGPSGVLPTIASRCQLVRFDPLPEARIVQRLRGAHGADAGTLAAGDAEALAASETAMLTADAPDPAGGAGSETLAACARLALGDAGLAARLASAEGRALRERAERFARGALRGETAERPWAELLSAAAAAGAGAGEQHAARVAEQLELVPKKERKRHEREAGEAQRRAERRARTGTLDLALRLAEAWLRDAWCTAEGAGEVVYAVDRRAELARDAAAHPPERLRGAVEAVRETRARLTLNVAEELAVEALAYRIQALGAGA